MARSGGNAFVVSLQAADVGELDHVPELGRLHGAMVRRVHLQGLVNPPPMVEVDVASQNPAQVKLVQDDDIVKALAAQRPDDPLRVGVLPGTSWCCGTSSMSRLRTRRRKVAP